MYRAIFRCSVCGEKAATLELTARPDPAAAQLVLRDFVWTRSAEAVKPEVVPDLEHALNAVNVRDLYTLNQLWAPFYCPECDSSYCLQHWQVTRTFDGDFPGWYDCSYGTCPEGHRRMIDD